MPTTARNDSDSPRSAGALPSGVLVFNSLIGPQFAAPATRPDATASYAETPGRRALFVLLGIDGAPAKPNSVILTDSDALRMSALPAAQAREEFSRRFCALREFRSANDRLGWIAEHQWCAVPPPFVAGSKQWINGVPNVVTGGVAVAVVATAGYMLMNRSRSNPVTVRNNPRRRRRSRRTGR